MIAKFTPESLAQAIELLQAGKLVALPTETVYGLAADATNLTAIKQVYKIKQRPASSALTVHIASIDAMHYWISSLPESAKKLAEHFWPGPLTLILPKASHVPKEITTDETIGLRCPAHPVTLKVLHEFKGLVMPSANRSGYPSPTTAKQVEAEFTGKLPLIIDTGPCQLGIASTIVDLTQTRPTILRTGSLAVDEIERVLSHKLVVNN